MAKRERISSQGSVADAAGGGVTLGTGVAGDVVAGTVSLGGGGLVRASRLQPSARTAVRIETKRGTFVFAQYTPAANGAQGFVSITPNAEVRDRVVKLCSLASST